MKKSLAILLAAITLASLVWVLLGGGATPTHCGRRVAAWVELSDSAEPATRKKAEDAFKVMGTNALPELIRLLGRDDPFWRKQAWAVSPRLTPRLRQLLLQTVGTPQAARRQILAGRCVAWLGPQAAPAIPALLRLVYGASEQVRCEAGMVLGIIGKPAVPALIVALDHRDPAVRVVALCALHTIPKPDRETAVPAILRLLTDPDERVRSAAFPALVSLGLAVLPSLTNDLASADAPTRYRAALALLHLRAAPPEAIAALSEMLRAPDVRSRRQALLAYSQIPPAEWPDLSDQIPALTDSNSEVRLMALLNLTRAGPLAAPAVPALKDCLTNSHPPVREWAARALGAIGGPARGAGPDLARLLNDTEARVRVAAGEALEKLSLTNSLVPEPGRSAEALRR